MWVYFDELIFNQNNFDFQKATQRLEECRICWGESKNVLIFKSALNCKTTDKPIENTVFVFYLIRENLFLRAPFRETNFVAERIERKFWLASGSMTFQINKLN